MSSEWIQSLSPIVIPQLPETSLLASLGLGHQLLRARSTCGRTVQEPRLTGVLAVAARGCFSQEEHKNDQCYKLLGPLGVQMGHIHFFLTSADGMGILTTPIFRWGN